MRNNRFWGWLSVVMLLALAVYCEYMVNDSLANSFLDVVITIAVFFIGFNDAKKKTASQQAQIQELQNRIAQLETVIANSNNLHSTEATAPQSSIDWGHAIRR